MSSIVNLIMQNLGSDKLSQISNAIGEDHNTTKSVIEQALPMLISSLANKNSNTSSGWNLLSGFLDQNHDGHVMDDLIGMALGSNNSGNQSNVNALAQILGNDQSRVEQHLNQNTGISASSIAKLLPLLAPIVIGALANMQKSQNLDQNGVNSLLQVEKEKIETSNPHTRGFFEAMLDKDGDGSVVDDLAQAGAGFLKNMMK